MKWLTGISKLTRTKETFHSPIPGPSSFFIWVNFIQAKPALSFLLPFLIHCSSSPNTHSNSSQTAIDSISKSTVLESLRICPYPSPEGYLRPPPSFV